LEDVHARAVAILCLALTFAAVAPASAADRPCVGDDVAALDQYCERLAGADGAEPIGMGGTRLADVLSAGVVAQLERAGPMGRALLVTPAASPTRAAAGGEDPRAARLALDGDLLPDSDHAGGALEAARALAQGSGADDPFRWGIALSTLCLVGVAWYRRHR
jgi:hypothetical protein